MKTKETYLKCMLIKETYKYFANVVNAKLKNSRQQQQQQKQQQQQQQRYYTVNISHLVRVIMRFHISISTIGKKDKIPTKT